MKAINLINNDVPPIRPYETMEKALFWMDEFKVKHLPIVEGSQYIGLLSDEGLEVLIHFGIDSVKLKGEGFETFVKEGQKVQVGDDLLKVDLEKVEGQIPSTTTPIIFTNLASEKKLSFNQKSVKHLESGFIDGL